MRRIIAPPRVDWELAVEEIGFTYHTIDGDQYWDEAGWYEFSLEKIETIEAATNRLHEMCLEAVQTILDQDRLDEFGIPAEFHDWVRASWDQDEPTLYGRFDSRGTVALRPRCWSTTPILPQLSSSRGRAVELAGVTAFGARSVQQPA